MRRWQQQRTAKARQQHDRPAEPRRRSLAEAARRQVEHAHTAEAHTARSLDECFEELSSARVAEATQAELEQRWRQGVDQLPHRHAPARTAAGCLAADAAAAAAQQASQQQQGVEPVALWGVSSIYLRPRRAAVRV